MYISFLVVETHSVAKELSGGRVRTRPGEPVRDAIARRIAQDTRCEVLACAAEGPEGISPDHYRLTLRGMEGGRPKGQRLDGAIRVKIVP